MQMKITRAQCIDILDPFQQETVNVWFLSGDNIPCR